MLLKGNCSQCRWWEQKRDAYGLCHGTPPNSDGEWPVTPSDEGCRNFDPTPGEDEAELNNPSDTDELPPESEIGK